MVHLIDVDVIRLKTFQRTLNVPPDLVSGVAVAVGAFAGILHVAVDLGSQDHTLSALSALGKPAAQDLFSPAGMIVFV